MTTVLPLTSIERVALVTVIWSVIAASANAQTGVYTPPTQAGGATGTGSATPATTAIGDVRGAPAESSPSPWTAAVSVQETYTTNVNLSGASDAKSAFVTEITPTFGLRYVSARATLAGDATLPMAVYLPSDAAGNRIYPTLNLLGDLTLVDNFLYLEGAVNVAQQFFNPFGAQPISVTNSTGNRYRTTVYRISPIIRGTTGSGTDYELRNDNVWTNLSGAPIDTANAHYTYLNGNATNTRSTLGWRATLQYTNVDFNNDQPSTVTQLYRGTAIYTATPTLRLTASGGWENNEFQFTRSQDVIYGAGFQWRPLELTSVIGDWEQRYFGPSYNVQLAHTTPLSEWRLSAARNVTTFPQQIATLPAGVNVSLFLNALLFPTIGDAGQRQQVVDQLMRDRGLPATLSGPVNLYTNQTLLQESYNASVALIGARNTVLLSGYWVKNQPITATGNVLPPLLSLGNDNTQTGGTVIWTHTLSPRLNVISSLELLQTTNNGGSGGQLAEARTRQGAVRVGVSTPITARTTAYAGARYQALRSDVAQDYTETAVFVGLTYTFR